MVVEVWDGEEASMVGGGGVASGEVEVVREGKWRRRDFVLVGF